jgi:predicted acyl esterase
MTRCSVLAFALLALAACERHPTDPRVGESLAPAAAAKQDDGPPAPHSFGSDSRETEGPNSGQGIAEPPLACVAGTEARTFSGYLETDVDRTLLDAQLDLPAGAGPFPLVVILHGWAGSKHTSGNIAQMLLEDGYAVLRYTARGFGDSWGKVNLADVSVERRDLQSMISRVVEQPGCATNPQAVAVTGASYGGAGSWLAAIEPVFQLSESSPEVHIRTILPIATWGDLLYSLLPNGQPRNSVDYLGGLKLSYVNGFYFGGLRTPDEGPQPWYVNYPSYLAAWHTYLNGPFDLSRDDALSRQIVDGLAGYRSIWWQQAFWTIVAANRIPIFQAQGFTDDLFPLDEAKRMLLALKTTNPAYPMALYLGDIGHPRASNKTGEVDYVLGLMRTWLAFYLKDEGTQPPFVIRAAITRPRDEPFDATNVLTIGTYAELATATVSQNFTGTAVLVNPVADPMASFFWDPLVMEAARELKPYPIAPPGSAIDANSLGVFEVPVSSFGRGSLLIAGQPAIDLKASTVAPRVQLNVRLLDVAPNGTRSLVTRGTYTLDGGSGRPLMSEKVTIATYGNMWIMPADHVLRIEISNLDSPYISPSKVPSVTEISQVRLTIPVR